MHSKFLSAAIFMCFIPLNLLYSFENREEIDKYLEKKDFDELNIYLGGIINDPEYPEIEAYLLQKVDEYVFNGEYEAAKSIVNILLYNNLDNEEAQKKYLEIKDLEEEEKAVEENITFDNFLFAYSFAPASFIFYQSFHFKNYHGENEPYFRYGISNYLQFYFNHPSVSAGIDFYLDTHLVQIGNESGNVISYRFVSAVIKARIRSRLLL